MGDVAGIVGGGTPSTKKSEYWNGNINWFTPAEIGNQIFVSHSQKQITELGLLKSSAKILPAGTILFTSRAGIGNTAILTRNACTNQGFQSIVPYSNKLDSYFIYSESAKLKRYGETMGSGSTFTEVSGKQMKKMSLHIPNINEQAKIGNMLKILDQTITLHEEKEHQLEQLKSALLQKMFADKSGYPAVRFEGFDEVWKHQKFSDIVKGLQNNTLSRSELNYECGTVKNIHYGDILTKFGEFIDASKTSLPYISDNTKADKFEKSFLKDGDIVIADTAEDDTVGKCVEIQGSEHLKISAGLHTIACRPKQQYGSKYLGCYFNSPVYHNQLHPLMQGIKVTSISKSSIQNTDVYIPQSVAEQSKIGDVLSKIDSLISLNQREVKKLSIIKQSLLQKMFI